jgi:hypothetical protein
MTITYKTEINLDTLVEELLIQLNPSQIKNLILALSSPGIEKTYYFITSAKSIKACKGSCREVKCYNCPFHSLDPYHRSGPCIDSKLAYDCACKYLKDCKEDK